MKLLLLFASTFIFFSIQAAKVTIEVRSAYDETTFKDAQIKVYTEGGDFLNRFFTNDKGQAEIKVRKPVEIKVESRNHRFYGGKVYVSRNDRRDIKVVYLYPSLDHEERLLKENGCTIAKKKTLKELEETEDKDEKEVGKSGSLNGEAEFPGGDNEMKRFLGRNIQYPLESMERGEQAKIYVQFIVNKDGKITCAQAVNEAPTLITAESLRVIRKMPNWEPAKADGETVRARCRVPINFVLQ